MVAGKKYLVWVGVWRKVCVCKERVYNCRYVILIVQKILVSFSFCRNGNGTSFTYLQLFSNS